MFDISFSTLVEILIRTVAVYLVILVGGGASVAIRITYAELAPFWAAASRFGIAALVFWDIASIRRFRCLKDVPCWVQ